MHWTDFVTLALITILLSLLIPHKGLLTVACFALGVGAGIYRGMNPHPSSKRNEKEE